MDQLDNSPGTRMSCSNPDCSCELEIVEPCPHGSEYTCACGHPMEVVESA